MKTSHPPSHPCSFPSTVVGCVGEYSFYMFSAFGPSIVLDSLKNNAKQPNCIVFTETQHKMYLIDQGVCLNINNNKRGGREQKKAITENCKLPKKMQHFIITLSNKITNFCTNPITRTEKILHSTIDSFFYHFFSPTNLSNPYYKYLSKTITFFFPAVAYNYQSPISLQHKFDPKHTISMNNKKKAVINKLQQKRKTYSILVDNIDNDNKPSILLPIVHKRHSSNLHKPPERLQIQNQ